MQGKKNSFLTINDYQETKHPVGKCRFITSVAPVKDESRARKFISGIREKYPDATHHVYAYRLGIGNNIVERSSDDREPAGTGGLPVLGVIRKKELTETVVVVTRYFGGVKLGVGGLIRAYRAAAEKGLSSVKTVKKYRMCRLKVLISYEKTGQLMRLISSFKGEVVNNIYDEKVTVVFLLFSGDIDKFKKNLKDATGGDAIILSEKED